ncbi:hypothetical protein [Sporomusa acidovorans]|uniref:hypothetical protein n=1 Tax=Sporomusa acidovorans TaxID=112900 RepID=UPI000880A8BF|nr:hypothetical protein [Sporomusa acidovorans]OZC19097.1 hypothetical protein SPACI_31830 [Sporomusa acidovorans DSM 3132]SDD67195.1 hypothetical protein SAMN04488499_100343 [Sporomusa acidovorans]
MRKLFIAVCVVSLLLIAGCSGQKSQTPPAPPAQQQGGGQQAQHNMANMEDPNPIMAQMNQALDDVAAKSQANKLTEARPSAGNLVTLNNRLSSHFSDTGFRDRLSQAITALNSEVNKPSPDKAAVDKQVETIRGLIKEAPSKMMPH